MIKPNYRNAKRQKELSRKTRQQEKLQRRSPGTGDAVPADKPAPQNPTAR